MNITLLPSAAAAVCPVIAAPPSKSDAHRLLILSALSENREPIFLSCRDTSADIDATVGCLRALGADITVCGGGYSVTPIDRTAAPAPDAEIFMNAGESGSTLRFLIPVIGALGASVCIKMEGRLPYRPLAPLDAVLEAHGMTLRRDPEDETLLHLSGQLTPGDYSIDGGISSQFISGLLFALPLLSAPSRLEITGSIASAPYIALTRSALSRFGYSAAPQEDGHLYRLTPAAFTPSDGMTVEGDWSGAAFLLCAGAMRHGVTVTSLHRDSVQGDQRILEVLRLAGCSITWNGDSVTVLPPKDGILSAFAVNADDIPDLVPPMAMLACAAHGETVITGCSRLRIKESDRLAAAVAMIRALGGTASSDEDSIRIDGSGTLTGGYSEGVNDHRMVMSAALGALISVNSVTVSDKEAIRKSYPGFFEDFSLFGVTEDVQNG